MSSNNYYVFLLFDNNLSYLVSKPSYSAVENVVPVHWLRGKKVLHVSDSCGAEYMPRIHETKF